MIDRSFNYRKLRDQKKKLVERAKALVDQAEAEGRALTPDEDAEWREIMDQIEVISAKIDRRVSDIMNMELPALVGGNEPISGSGFARNLKDGILLRSEEPVAPYIPRGPEGEVHFGKLIKSLVLGERDEQRVMSGADSVLGGYLLPGPIVAELIDLARNASVLNQLGARTFLLGGRDAAWPRQETDPTPVWRHENMAISESDISFSRLSVSAKTLAAIVRCSVELIEDSPADILRETVMNSLAKSIALGIDYAGLFGQGAAAEPLGLYNWGGVNVVQATGGSLDYDLVLDAVEKVELQNGTPTGLVLHPKDAAVLRKLKSTEGVYLAPPPAFERLKAVVSNQVRADLGTGGNETVAFVGDFSQAVICVRTQMVLEASREASDAFPKMQVLFRAYWRGDILVARPEHFTKITGLVHT